MKDVHPSLSQQYYSEEIQWMVIENIADRNFTMTEQTSTITERVKYKQSSFLQDLCSTD